MIEQSSIKILHFTSVWAASQINWDAPFRLTAIYSVNRRCGYWIDIGITLFLEYLGSNLVIDTWHCFVGNSISQSICLRSIDDINLSIYERFRLVNRQRIVLYSIRD